MRKIATVIILVLLACLYLFINRQKVTVINAHHVGNAVAILVDRLPFNDSAKITWWEKNQDEIRSKYHILSGTEGPFLITVFAFGDGYQKEGKEDRLCFEDVELPRNCIDKNILMTIWRTREGGVEYDP